MGALRDETALNIRERGGRRKRKPVLNEKTATPERWGWPSVRLGGAVLVRQRARRTPLSP